MQWFGRRESDNVEVGSSSGGRGFLFGGGIIGLIGFVIYLFTGINPAQLLDQGQNSQQSDQQNTRVDTRTESDQQKFARVVLADTEDIWGKLFSDMGKIYTPPTLHFYTGGVDTRGCGFAQSATGPFYCPGDQKVYLDLSFFDELQNRFGAGGDFARAYVIAHEVGHHVQDLLGVTAQMQQMRNRLSSRDYNKLSVKLELQADFYAGVWAHYEQSLNHVVDPGDIDEALNAANQIGDDRLQQETQGRVEPDSFTHGTSAQRQYWFKKGYETGDVNAGNTFKAGDLE